MLSWKGPTKITDSHSWPCTEHSKSHHVPENVVKTLLELCQPWLWPLPWGFYSSAQPSPIVPSSSHGALLGAGMGFKFSPTPFLQAKQPQLSHPVPTAGTALWSYLAFFQQVSILLVHGLDAVIQVRFPKGRAEGKNCWALNGKPYQAGLILCICEVSPCWWAAGRLYPSLRAFFPLL